MDLSWLKSLLLGLPVAVLAMLKIIDWYKKRAAFRRAAHRGEQSEGEPIIMEQPSSEGPTSQELDSIICQAEMAAAVDRQIAEELRHYEAGKRRSAGVL